MKFSGSKSTVLVKAFINVSVNILFEFLYEVKFSSLTIKLIKCTQMEIHRLPKLDGRTMVWILYCHDSDGEYISVEEMQNMSNENCIQHILTA